jgi:ornithine cyclodeaminase/alanine dehydrogenase
MAATDPRPLRYLAARDVEAAMPSLEERLRLAERTMIGLVRDAELPAKIGVHPRPEASFGHAMPAYLRAGVPADERLGMKWVVGFPANNAIGLPSINALIVLNDPATGLPIAVLDGAPVTAQRTAAISGVVLRRFGPVHREGPVTAALIGAGVQGRAHLPVLGAVLPGVDLRVHDRHPDRSESFRALAEATPGIGRATSTSSARAAIEGADVVVTAAAFTTPERRQVMTQDWLAPDATVVPVDYATFCAAEVARDAALFLVDHREQFLGAREAGAFDGYPDPSMSIGEALLDGVERPARGRVVATHLGVGLADVIFGAAILEAAEQRGLGTVLDR